MSNSGFPTLKQVLKADAQKLREWYKNLPTAQTQEQQDVIALIYKRIGGTKP